MEKEKKVRIKDILKSLKEKADKGGFVSEKELLESREKTKEKQQPIAVFLSCSDSRVIPEYIFKAKYGELFVVRSAGNNLDVNALASIEYAIKHLNVDLVVVLGHTNCGAVKAAVEGIKGHREEKFLPMLIDKIKENIENEKDVKKAAIKNVNKVKEKLKELFKGSVEVLGAIYNLETGKVEWID
jgi:carbonic anhydrase